MNKKFIFLFLIIILGTFLRLYLINSVPPSLNPDETALGYNAYSLLKTGADEHGKFLPITLQSFGDWKLPVYPFIDVLPIAVFGLTEFAVRFPSIISGIVGIFLIYLICQKLFQKHQISLFSAFFFAVSPWSIYFSRAAYEVNVATTFFLAGLFFFTKYLDKEKLKPLWLTLSVVFFALTLFTYNSFIIFTPLFLICLVYLNRKKIQPNLQFFIPSAFFIVITAISLYLSIFASTNKTSTLLVFNDPNTIYNRVEKIRGDGVSSSPVEKIIYNKFTGGIYQFGQNYLSAFSPAFLFDKGGEKLVDNLGYIGNLYLIDALFMLLGFAGLILQKERNLKLIVVWLLLSPVPSALTKNPLSSTRLFLLIPVLTMISAYGVWQMLEFLKKGTIKNYFIKTVVLLVFVYNVALFMDGYFVHFNAQRARFWRYGYQQAVELSQKYPNYNIVFRGPENFPYIYFLFFNKYNPTEFRYQVKYYTPTSEGFVYVKSFGRFSFPEVIGEKMEPKTIYIDDNQFKFKNKILLPSGEPVLSYYINN